MERETVFRENLISVESSLCEVELPMLEELTDAFYQYIVSLDKGGVSGVAIGAGTAEISGLTNWDRLNYNPIKVGEDNTSCLDIRNHPELYDSLVNSYAYLEANADAVEAVTPLCNEVTETYVTERKYEEGWAQIRNGVLLALSTYGAAKAGIILGGIAGLSAGAAKLIKGISYLSSGISGTFMVSEFFEGSQNISISLQKLNGQDAVNPLKSFLGEETYQKAMVASSLCSDLIGGAGAIKELVSIGREKAVGSLVDDVVVQSNNKVISKLSNKAVKHPMNDHMPVRYAKQLKYMSKEAAEQYLSYKTFFNSTWTDEQVKAALNFGYKEALNSGVITGKYTFKYLGENVTVYLEEGMFKTGYGDYVYTYDELLKLLGGE